MKMTFYVPTLTQESEPLLRSTLERVHGVTLIESDFVRGHVTVEYSVDQTNELGIRAVAAGAGFELLERPAEASAPRDAPLPEQPPPAQPTEERVAEPNSAYRQFRAVKFFGSLDGLRAASILAVVWHHTGATIAPEGFLGQGTKGVTLFFVISGFLIVTLLLREKDRAGSISLSRFWGRRMCRILPVYYVVLGIYIGLVAWFERDEIARATFFENLPAFATFTSNWFVTLDAPRVIFVFAWSLAAEEQFYLVWPWVERWLPKTTALMAAVAALVVTQMVGFAWGATANSSLPIKIISSVPAGILLGVILAHCLHSEIGFRALWGVCGQRWSAPFWVAATLTIIALIPTIGEDLGGLLAAVVMVPLVAACVMREDNGLATICQLGFVAWLGTVSYGMYLLHMLSVNVVQGVLRELKIASPLLDFIAGAILAAGLASVSYLTLERFFLTLKDRWFKAPFAPPMPTNSQATSPHKPIG